MRPIAIYLPQYHPIPENDAWWGKGFTEWRNVVKGRPLFAGHYQPHLPADLGYYDLRLADIREDQARLARHYGIHGFCYYHYWFNGRRILETPFQKVIESGSPDFPFMLCWANENWTRIWDGGQKNILLEQHYSESDNIAHIEHLVEYFKDSRYIRIGNRPVFAFYKDEDIPDLPGLIRTFREVAGRHGIELYLCRFDRRLGNRAEPPKLLGLDAAIEFQPWKSLIAYSRTPEMRFAHRTRRLRDRVTSLLRRLSLARNSSRKTLDHFYDYKKFVAFDIRQPLSDYTRFPGVCPGWDNTARRREGGATVLVNGDADTFATWVEHKARLLSSARADPGEDLMFINAWNEWAEGNHLEPCERNGHAYLEALRDGLIRAGETNLSG